MGFLNDKVSSFILNGTWNLPYSFRQMYPEVSNAILATPLPIDNACDQVIWAASSSGSLSTSDAYNSLCHSFPVVAWENVFGMQQSNHARDWLLEKLFKKGSHGCSSPEIECATLF